MKQLTMLVKTVYMMYPLLSMVSRKCTSINSSVHLFDNVLTYFL